ncbi:DUF6062 family protein [Candidatus Formimonas warabiya]|uniref:Uncharacterized protein n=1 Tax=Formimonas warabiya TaxID=1761012 RepID=A0A3G1KS66_FORW1|nr:DUF6062 family protein [Candidatus Formimonas warabiya]ATW25234.1 hypothetical protein DCMF_11060 [Candidatus Formimonas warabiya]
MEYDLESAFKQPGCPICTMIKKSMDSYFRWFENESDHLLELLISLSRGGFCRDHAQQVAASVKSDLNYTYAFIIRTRQKEIKQFLQETALIQKKIFPYREKNDPHRELNRIISSEPCPVCDLIQKTGTYGSAMIARKFEDPINRELYRESAGLCWEHCANTLLIAPPEIGLFLLEDHLQRLEDLNREFREFFRKQDYRFDHEPKGKEQTAWVRAMELLNGRPYSF